MAEKKTMKQLFNEKKKLVRKTNEIGRELDKMIIEKWGFSFSETDDDPMIDTLDYGTNSICFEEFEDRMNRYKKSFEDNGRFEAIP